MNPDRFFISEVSFSHTYLDPVGCSGFHGSYSPDQPLRIPPGFEGTLFGYNQGDSHMSLFTDSFEYTIAPGMYFAVNRPVRISDSHQMWAVGANRYSALNSIGGPVEDVGRLRYIDGCTDSLLIPPVIKGDPCLNALFFPPGIKQTFHTHPSSRIGLVISGEGVCDDSECQFPLKPGMAFFIPPDSLHRFQTLKSSMQVLAFHPDSDFGPEHQCHPMINRTIVEGTPASLISDIQT